MLGVEHIKGGLKEFIKNILMIQEYHLDVEIKEYVFQEDPIHLVVIIPPSIPYQEKVENAHSS